MASPRKIAKLIQAGVDHFKAQQYVRAEGVLLDAVASDQCQHGALHLLGVLALQNGRNEIAIARWERALAVAPGVASYLSNLGEAHRRIDHSRRGLSKPRSRSSQNSSKACVGWAVRYGASGAWTMRSSVCAPQRSVIPATLQRTPSWAWS